MRRNKSGASEADGWARTGLLQPDTAAREADIPRGGGRTLPESVSRLAAAPTADDRRRG